MNSNNLRKLESFQKSFNESFATFAKKALIIYLVTSKITGLMFERLAMKPQKVYRPQTWIQ